MSGRAKCLGLRIWGQAPVFRKTVASYVGGREVSCGGAAAARRGAGHALLVPGTELERREAFGVRLAAALGLARRAGLVALAWRTGFKEGTPGLIWRAH